MDEDETPRAANYPCISLEVGGASQLPDSSLSPKIDVWRALIDAKYEFKPVGRKKGGPERKGGEYDRGGWANSNHNSCSDALLRYFQAMLYLLW